MPKNMNKLVAGMVAGTTMMFPTACSSEVPDTADRDMLVEAYHDVVRRGEDISTLNEVVDAAQGDVQWVEVDTSKLWIKNEADERRLSPLEIALGTVGATAMEEFEGSTEKLFGVRYGTAEALNPDGLCITALVNAEGQDAQEIATELSAIYREQIDIPPSAVEHQAISYPGMQMAQQFCTDALRKSLERGVTIEVPLAEEVVVGGYRLP